MKHTHRVRRTKLSKLIAQKHVRVRKKILGAVSTLMRLASKDQQGNGERLAAIWHLEKSPAPLSLAAYDQHIESLLHVNAQLPQLKRAGDVTELIEFLKENRNESIEHVVTEICHKKLCGALSEKAAFVAIDLGLRLWVFISPDLRDRGISLVESIWRSVSNIDADSGLSAVEKLSEDFSEESLSKKGGFTVVWTSNLLEHLSFESPTTLRVFHHASALRNFDTEASKERDFFPEEFLSETRMTMRLLFPPNDLESSKRIKRLAKKRLVDLEAHAAKTAPLILASYPIWRHRLAEVQRRYDAVKPGTLKQWWHDRRNKLERITFWTAIVVIVLTLIFGLISSVTGILQVVAAWRTIPRPA